MKESHKRTEDKKTGQRKKKKKLESTFVSVSDHAGCVCAESFFWCICGGHLAQHPLTPNLGPPQTKLNPPKKSYLSTELLT